MYIIQNMNDTYMDFVRFSLSEASRIAEMNFGKVAAVSVKGNDSNQVLTETDLEIGGKLIELIHTAYPDHNVIDEEKGCIDRGSRYTWVIDPIDGTSNFAAGIPTYGIILGLLDGGVPVAGGFSLPYFHEITVAQRGQGAYCNGEQLRVSTESSLLSSLVAYQIDGHQEDPDLTREESRIFGDVVLATRNIRTSGSVFDSLMVAKGKYGLYLNQTSKIWDNVGVQIVIEESGGIFTDFFGKPMDYSDPLTKADRNYTACFGAPQLHRQMQDSIKKAGTSI